MESVDARAQMQTPNGSMNIVVTPEASFMAVPGQGTRDLPASQKAETLAQIKRRSHLHCFPLEGCRCVFPCRWN
jgi:hypothetical protein